LIATHAQLVLGLILYFISPYVNFASGVMKDKILRFYTIEHFVGMILAIVLITIGYSRAKRQNEAGAKFRTHYVYYLLGLIIILLSIPWPFRDLGAGWF
jgi:membrane protein DedA with SNARE-associated domain